MEFVAIRENMRLQTVCGQLETSPAAPRDSLQHQHPGQGFGAAIPREITPEFVRDEVARGRAVITANINHPELEPMIIGRNFLVKINANIGNSAVTSTIEQEVSKMVWAMRWGADTVMDLSTGPTFTRPANGSCETAPRRSGLFPFTRHSKKSTARRRMLTWEIFASTLIEQAEQGVDYFTIHAGVRLRYIPLTAKAPHRNRFTQAARFWPRWCLAHHAENFLYTHFEEYLRDHEGI